MDVYLVGGAVRDELLGRATADLDWVVIGETPEAMLERGYQQVGRDFPVFLHPQTHEEYALARTERKTGAGHQGFVCHAGVDVTLEQDLERRDLTINAIAKSPTGMYVDPFGGQQDLQDRVLRHVSPAFVEDPLRVFRVARFAATLPGFEVAPETLALMQTQASSGELAGLSAERVWQELSKALLGANPLRFVQVLRQAQALEPWLPELGSTAEQNSLATLGHAPAELSLRYALLGHGLTAESAASLGKRLKAPLACQRLLEQTLRHQSVLLAWLQRPTLTQASGLYAMLADQGAFKPKGWPADLISVAAWLTGGHSEDFAALNQLVDQLLIDISPRDLMAQGFAGAALGTELARLRLQAIERWLGLG